MKTDDTLTVAGRLVDPSTLHYRKAKKKTLANVCKIDAPFAVQTKEGIMEGKAGDYLAVGGHNDYYPIAAHIFHDTYEFVDGEEK